MINEVLKFWFEELEAKDWWVKNEDLDQTIKKRFQGLHSQAVCGELFSWRETPEGRLAEIIVIDQFSRNMFRGDPRSWQYDPMSLVLAQEAVRIGADLKLQINQRKFLYMPYMHSESKLIHEQALKLFSQAGLEENLKFEHAHKEIIDRFGRYPHRNEILGRVSSAEEINFLKQPNSSF